MVDIHEHRAHEIICWLAGELIKGWKAFLVAEKISISSKNKTSSIPEELAKIIYNSCLETSIFALAKITDSNKSSISIQYLLKYAENNRSAFPLLQLEENQKKIITGYKELYKQFTPTFKKIKDQRNKLLAHLDKKLLNDPNLHINNPITEDELRDAFARLKTIIYEFANYLSEKADIPRNDKSLNHKIADYFTILFSKSS